MATKRKTPTDVTPSSKTASTAGKALGSKKSSSTTKTLAGTVLANRNEKHKKP